MNTLASKTMKQEVQQTFCFLLVEEFLMKKNMTNTLNCFREEWNRPDDVRKFHSFHHLCLIL